MIVLDLMIMQSIKRDKKQLEGDSFFNSKPMELE